MNTFILPRIPTRPMLRWHGGKWRMAAWIMQHMPRHRAIRAAHFNSNHFSLIHCDAAHGEVSS